MKRLAKEARDKRKKYRKKRKKHVPSKAANIAMENIENETLNLLDPIKNAKDKDLFILDTDPNARPKMIKDKVTWAERATSSRGLGVQLPKFTGKTAKEKRVIGGLKDLEIINAKVERMTGGGQKEGGKKEEAEEQGEDVMEVERPEGVEPSAKRVKVEDEKKPIAVLLKKETKVENNGNKIVVEKKSSVKVYDLWAAAPERPVNPKQSFIQEVLYPPKRTFTPDPVESKLPAVPLPPAVQSYRPDPEAHNALKRKRTKKEKVAQEAAEQTEELITNLKGPGFFLPISKDDEEEGEGEQEEPVRAEPQRHRTEKEKRLQHEKNVRKDQEIREKLMKRRQREISRAAEIMEGIEEEEKKKEERLARKMERRNMVRGTLPRTADNKTVAQPAVTELLSAPSQRLRTINAIVNPLKERILSMKSRGLINEKKRKNPRPAPLYKYVEPQSVQEYMKADEEKYLKPILDQVKRGKK